MDYTKTANKETAKKAKGKLRKPQNQSKKLKVLFITYLHFRPLLICNPASIGIGWSDNCAIGSPEVYHSPLKINLIL